MSAGARIRLTLNFTHLQSKNGKSSITQWNNVVPYHKVWFNSKNFKDAEQPVVSQSLQIVILDFSPKIRPKKNLPKEASMIWCLI